MCLDSWVGGIKAVNSRLTLQCGDGSRCIVKDPDTVAGFEVFDEKRDNVSTISKFPLKVTMYSESCAESVSRLDMGVLLISLCRNTHKFSFK